MQGLRTQEDSKFEKFFELVQSAAEKQGTVFFMDCGEGREVETDSLSGEDLSGWLIPLDKVDKFEAVFQAGEVPPEWAEFICFASWVDSGNQISIRFLHF